MILQNLQGVKSNSNKTIRETRKQIQLNYDDDDDDDYDDGCSARLAGLEKSKT